MAAAAAPPPPVNPQAATPFTPGTFSYILEADHDKIRSYIIPLTQAFASLKTANPTPEATLNGIVDELTWRLIRHDVCEELVMRPAYVKYLGQGGTVAAESDRKDHADAKETLLGILPLAPSSQEFQTRIMAMIKDLAGHMIRESGGEIPLLESQMSATDSAALAQSYIRSQLLTPSLTWEQVRGGAVSEPSYGGYGSSDTDTTETGKVWTSTLAFATTPMTRFAEVLGMINVAQQQVLGDQVVKENIAAVTPEAEAFTQQAVAQAKKLAEQQAQQPVAPAPTSAPPK